MASPTTVHLKATYTSPTVLEPQTLASTPLSLPVSNRTVQEKTTYLSALRTATIAMQERINTELTARMEEDNKNTQGGDASTTTATKNSAKTQVIDEAAEEENYGEEVQEEEDV